MFLVMGCYGAAQFGRTQRVGVADAPVGQRPCSGLADQRRRRIGRLPHRHGDHRLAERLQPVGFGEHVHRVEGLDIAAPGE
jgi:hypothetical protein